MLIHKYENLKKLDEDRYCVSENSFYQFLYDIGNH